MWSKLVEIYRRSGQRVESVYPHELNSAGTACAEDCPACHQFGISPERAAHASDSAAVPSNSPSMARFAKS